MRTFIMNFIIFISSLMFHIEYIWRLLENSKLDEACPQRDDLRKFLKAVSQYLFVVLVL